MVDIHFYAETPHMHLVMQMGCLL